MREQWPLKGHFAGVALAVQRLATPCVASACTRAAGATSLQLARHPDRLAQHSTDCFGRRRFTTRRRPQVADAVAGLPGKRTIDTDGMTDRQSDNRREDVV